MKNGAPPPGRPGAMRMSPSAPTPKWRSQIALTCAGVISSWSRGSSTTTKSLPVPCALTNSTRCLSVAAQLVGGPVDQVGAVVRRGPGPGGKGTPSHPRVPAEPGELAAGVAAGAGGDLLEGGGH